MTISLDRTQCCDLNETISREWLVTNGLGGYAAGTVAGVLTRMQHGLFVTTPPDALTAQLLLAKIDEEVTFDQRTYYLGTNEYKDGTINPSGFVHLETFHLEEGFPIFTYRLGGIDGILLEKRIWMVQGYNTTYIQYRILPQRVSDKPGNRRSGMADTSGQASTGLLAANTQKNARSALTLTLLPFTAYRPIAEAQRGHNAYHFQIQTHTTAEQHGDREDHGSTALPAGVAGCTIQAHQDAEPYHLLAVASPHNQATFIPTGVWYWNFMRRCDRGQDQRPMTDDLYLPGVIKATLYPEEDATLTIVVSTEELDARLFRSEQIARYYKESVRKQEILVQQALQTSLDEEEREHEKELRVLPLTTTSDPNAGGLDYLQHLLYGKEHFLAQYPTQNKWPGNRGSKRSDGLAGHQNPYHSRARSLFTQREPNIVILAEYFSMKNRTRDALIALPGLLLVPEYFSEAQQYLHTLAGYFIKGSLPESIPLAGQTLTDADYRSVDIPLWFCSTLDAYLRATEDYALLEAIFPTLEEWVQHYIKGTNKGIHVDQYTSLLHAEKEGHALTWMNAMKDGVAVTPRAGKAVEVNALWYHALSLMAEWSEILEQYGYSRQGGLSAGFYRDMAERCCEHFHKRFWNKEEGYLYDVVEGPTGNDASLRINQLFALSLRHPILDKAYHQRILRVLNQSLMTPYGLRTLASNDPAYHGHLTRESGSNTELDPAALHQGAIWTWLLGPYMDATLSQQLNEAPEQDTKLVQEFLWRRGMHMLEPLKERLHVTLLGMCEGIFAGDGPVASNMPQPGLQLASAMTTGELLRIYTRLTGMRIEQPEHALSH